MAEGHSDAKKNGNEIMVIIRNPAVAVFSLQNWCLVLNFISITSYFNGDIKCLNLAA